MTQHTQITPEQIRERLDQVLQHYPAGVPIPLANGGLTPPPVAPAAAAPPADTAQDIPFGDFPKWTPPAPESFEQEAGEPIPAPDHSGRTAELWGAYLATPITRLDVDNLFALAEIARARAEQDAAQ